MAPSPDPDDDEPRRDDAGEPACLMHLLCEECGCIHGEDEPCPTRRTADV
jgi:hypothetical protein